MVRKCFFVMVSLLVVFSSISCSYFTPRVVETSRFKEWVSGGDTPRIIATLPFTNETGVENLDQLVREAFYKHFSVRNFFDIEIREVDGIIEVLRDVEERDFHTLSSRELGEFLRCDALVYGRITRFQRIFLLIYSQMLIEAEIKIVEAESGNELWKHTFSKRFHEGGVPTGPFGVIPTAIRTSYSLREDKRNRDIDAFCKHFVGLIPETRHIQAREIDELCELQLASFKMKEGALTISSTLHQHGYKPFLRKIGVNSEIWYRVMLGPFVSRSKALCYQLKLKREFGFLNPIVLMSKDDSELGVKQDLVK